MIDPKLLEMLCCPETRQPLRPAPVELLQRLNQEIEAGRLHNRGGQPVTRRCDGGLVRQDQKFLYPICENIPILIANEAIAI